MRRQRTADRNGPPTTTLPPCTHRHVANPPLPERLFAGHEGTVVAAIGHSIFNRTCPISAGDLCAKYGGGGHKGAGTTQLAPDSAEEKIEEILTALRRASPA